MSLTAKYEADFNEFYSATDRATTKLEAWDAAGAKVETQMDGIATSLSGAPLVSDATAASGAMDDLGGATAEIPPHLQDIAEQGSMLPGIFGTAAAAFASAFTVQAITNFALGVIETASAIGDMSEKLGVSTEAIQRWQYAADQGGSSIDDVERALVAMNRKLAEGDTSTRGALEAVGLQFDDIRAMQPEEAFYAIGDAVGKIEDPMLQAQIATELFLKAGVELIPAFEAGLRKVGAETKVMSDDTIARLKAAEDAWGRLANTVTIASGTVIAKTFGAWDAMNRAFEAMATGKDPFVAINDSLLNTTANVDRVATTIEKKAPTILRAITPAAQAVGGLEVAFADLAKTATYSTEVVGLVEPKLGSLADFTRRAAKETEHAREYTDLWNTGLRFTSEVIGELPPKLEAVASGIAEVTRQQDAATAAVSKQAPGAVGVNTGGIQVGNLDAAFEQYSKRYGGGSLGGSFNAAPSEDFLSWALKWGKASQGGAGGQTVNVTMNGMLGANDPQTRQMVRDLVGEAMTDGMRGQRLLSSA